MRQFRNSALFCLLSLYSITFIISSIDAASSSSAGLVKRNDHNKDDSMMLLHPLEYRAAPFQRRIPSGRKTTQYPPGEGLFHTTKRHAETSNIETCKDTDGTNPFLDYLFDSYSNPLWVFDQKPIKDEYYDNQYWGKDWSPYYTCEGNDCEFTKLANAAEGACFSEGRALYKVNVTVICPGDEEEGPFTDVNIPVCVSPSCRIDDDFVLQNEMYSFAWCNGGENPSSDEFILTEELVPSPITEDCLEETRSFSKAAGGGDQDFVYNTESFDYMDFCSPIDEDGKQTCDFIEVVESLKATCEAEGGIMYKFSDTVYYTEGYYDGLRTLVSLNIPICVGASCSGKAFFEDIIDPLLKFSLEGGYFEDGILAYNSTYEMMEYSAVSEEKSSAQALFFSGVTICVQMILAVVISSMI